jgi:hypothetical protein
VTTLTVLLVLVAATGLGHLVLSSANLRPSLPWGGDLVIAFMAGIALMTLVAFWVSLFAASAALAVSLALAPLASLLAVFLAVRRWRRPETVPPRLTAGTALVAVLGVLAVVDIGSVLFATYHAGPGWDGLFVWSIKARYFATTGGVPSTFFDDLSRQWSHLDYPFLYPLTVSFGYWLLGGSLLHADMVVTLGFVLGLIILFHSLVREVSGPVLAVLFTVVLVTVPAFWTNATRAYADLPLALFLLGGAGMVARWLRRRDLRDVIVGGALLAFAIWVKRDGLMMWAAAAAAVTAATVILRREVGWYPIAGFLAPALLLAPWWATVTLHHIVDPSFAPLRSGWLFAHLDRVPSLLQTLAGQLLLTSAWGFVWVLAAAALILRPPLRSPARAFLIVVVAAHLLSLTLIYTLSTWDPYTNHVNSSIDRLVFQALPVVLLFLSASILEVRTLKSRTAREPYEFDGLAAGLMSNRLVTVFGGPEHVHGNVRPT